MAITVTTTTASTIRITISFLLGRHLGDSLHRLERLDVLLRAGLRGARRAARLNVVERALVAGVGGVGNLSPTPKSYAGAQVSGTPKSAATIQVVKPTKSGMVRLSSMRSGSGSQPAAASAIVPEAPAIASAEASAPRPSTRAAITSVGAQKASEPWRVRLRADRPPP